MKGYPRGFVTLIHATILALCVSGLLLAPTTLDLRLELPVPWRLPADGRSGVAALHVVLSYAIVIFAGALWHVHMRVGWRRRRNLWAGGALVLTLLILAGSGVAVFYLGGELEARCAAVTHLIAGAGLPLLLVVHVVAGRASVRARVRPRASVTRGAAESRALR